MDLLNRVDCIQIIREAYNLNISNEVNLIEYKIFTPLDGTTTGYAGEYYKLKLIFNIDNSEPITKIFFIKTIPQNDEQQKKIVEELDTFKKEDFMYKVAKDMKKYTSLKWRPDCYYRRKNLMVLEDLYDDYRHLKDDETFLLNIKPVLKSLAAMHGSSIIYENKTGMNLTDFPEYLEEKGISRDADWFHVGLTYIEKIASIHPEYKNYDLQNGKLVEKLNSIYDIIAVSEKFQNTLCHRDLWEKNIFFKFDESNSKAEEACLVDFQLLRYHPPAIDVLSFIYINTRKKDRDLNLEDWLKYYHNCLSEIVNENQLDINEFLSWKEFTRSCDYIRLLPLTMAAVYIPLTSLPNDLKNMIKSKYPNKYAIYVLGNRDKLVMESLDNSGEYRDHIFEAIGELVEYVLRRH